MFARSRVMVSSSLEGLYSESGISTWTKTAFLCFSIHQKCICAPSSVIKRFNLTVSLGGGLEMRTGG